MKKVKLVVLVSIMGLFFITGCTDSKSQIISTETSIEQGIDLNGTYNQNDLIVHTVEKNYENMIAEIPQIEGLLNQDTEDKINRDIYNRVTNICDKNSSINFLNYSTMSNFANVISLSIYWGSDDTYDQLYLNYNLVNGEILTFEDLFCKDTDTLEIIRKAFHESLILNEMNGNIDENELYKIVKSFSESDKKEFAFTPAKIYLYCKDYVASVKIAEIADKVAIYSKYDTKDILYNGEYNGRKNIMTCVDIPEDAFDLMKFGLIADNCWFDITSMKEYIGDEFPKEKYTKYTEFKTKKYNECYEQIKNYADEVKNHPDQFYIVLSKPSFYLTSESEWDGTEWLETYGDTVEITTNLTVYKMPLELYENIYREKLVEAYRYDYLAMAGGIYLDAEGLEIQVEENYNHQIYNYMTGEGVN